MQNFDSLPLAEALRLLRARHRLRQFQVAKNAGITKAMLSSFETGKTRPSLGSLLSVLAGMGSDLSELQEAIDILTGKRVVPEKSEEPPGSDVQSGDFVQVRINQLEELVPVLERIAAAIERT